MIAFNFAYNLYTLLFMKASEQLEQDRLQTSLREMNIGELTWLDHNYFFVLFKTAASI